MHMIEEETRKFWAEANRWIPYRAQKEESVPKVFLSRD